nr:immunoglobulin heavy chain junction region [Macaca mulatta]MOX63544.1 immunoglobulin heavy chain junction region [Macaca mulatta]MOX65686.1 immunoglobulin heavy chain junction region [Macaca mulatta]
CARGTVTLGTLDSW